MFRFHTPSLRTRRGHALVLGAGIQGISTALGLSHEGWSVTLIDQESSPMRGTSLRGEGKIHLGYVYAKDSSLRTARRMVDSAVSFGEVLSEWLPELPSWNALRSPGFLYAVPHDSMVGPDALQAHYAQVDDLLAARLSDSRSSAYVGDHLPARVQRLADPQAAGFGPDIVAAFRTPEVALDPTRLRRALLDALLQRNVSLRMGWRVNAVERRSHGMRVLATRADGARHALDADVVVNCLWAGRLAVDASLGIAPQRPWSYRLKYALHGHLPHGARLPTTTLVLGPYGDLVHWPDGRCYLSWYPACMSAWSGELEAPEAWRACVAGVPAAAERQRLIAASLPAMDALLPGAAALRVEDVAAGVIVAWGDTDIDSPSSALHRRDEIGVHEHGAYISVDTGKLTCAPHFSRQVVAALAGRALPAIA